MDVRTVGGRYAIEGRIGEGPLSPLYRVRHVRLGTAFGLMFVAPPFGLDAEARTRFLDEARLASEISHPNLVPVLDFGEDAQLGAYLVMELVEGEPLLGDPSPAMSVRRACDLLSQIADALDHIHRRGVVHGDLKADTIVVSMENHGARRRRLARLLDIGLARRTDSADGPRHGSPHYLSPERAAGGPPSVAADIYALGVLGYRLLTGAPPFDGNLLEIMMAHLHAEVAPPSRRRGEPIEPAVERVILRALAKDPARRHASAASFRADLNEAMDALELVRRRHPSVPVVSDRRRDAILVAAFERSLVPQALISLDGDIVVANRCFARLVGVEQGVEGRNVCETILARVIPSFARLVRSVHDDGRLCERRARVPRGDAAALDLTLWLSPLGAPGLEVHLLVRVEEVEGD